MEAPRDIIRTVNLGLAHGTGKLCLRRNWPKSRIQLRFVLSLRALIRRPLTTNLRVTRFRVPPGREYNFDYCHPSKDRSSKASCTFPTHQLLFPWPPFIGMWEGEACIRVIYMVFSVYTCKKEEDKWKRKEITFWHRQTAYYCPREPGFLDFRSNLNATPLKHRQIGVSQTVCATFHHFIRFLLSFFFCYFILS